MRSGDLTGSAAGLCAATLCVDRDTAEAVKQAGQSTADGIGNWAKSTAADLVQPNDGFKTNLIGTPEQVARRILELKRAGIDLVLAGFLHFQEEVEYFGRRVYPLVRELEAEAASRATEVVLAR